MSGRREGGVVGARLSERKVVEEAWGEEVVVLREETEGCVVSGCCLHNGYFI